MLKFNNKVPTDIKIGNKTVEKILMRNEVVWSRPDYFYIENTYVGKNTISIKRTISGTPSSSTFARHLEYSKDKVNWTTFKLSSTTYNITLNQGEKVYLRGDEGVLNYSIGSNGAVTNITGSQSHILGGNINSLLNYLDINNVVLPVYVFKYLFRDNNKLISAYNLSLPTITLSEQCYYSMFEDCTSLTTAPALLPATTLASGCYWYMFMGCTSLTTAPTLPATTLAAYCYNGMFQDCTSLTTAPTLPATTLTNSCYGYMFSGCTSLTTAPTLPATTLANVCYGNMFSGCTSLVNPPDLPATTLTNRCYYYMFSGCTSLNKVTTYANDISASNCIDNWLQNVAPVGTFYNNGTATYTIDSPSGIPVGWTEVKPPISNYFYVENAYNGNNTIELKMYKDGSSKHTTHNFVYYSYDKTTWTPVDVSTESTTTIPMVSGQKVYMRSKRGTWHPNTTNIVSIYCTQAYNVGGELISLIDYSNRSVTLPNYCFTDLFEKTPGSISNNTNLLDAHNLILPSNLSESCFDHTFAYCKSLTSVPQFQSNTVLAKYCFDNMYNYCTSLTTAPNLPFTTLANGCYDGMFKDCTSLTTAPALPATTLAPFCYQNMFEGCELLTTAPVLPATTLTESCYYYMFKWCSSLNEVTTYANDVSARNCLSDWLSDVASTGTFHNLGSATYSRGTSGIPRGWTEVKS